MRRPPAWRCTCMRTLIVQVDDREKAGKIVFPEYARWRSSTVRVETERKRLLAGDYRLKSWPRAAIIERKGSPMELYACLLGGRVRDFAKQLDKLVKKAHLPVLLLTCGVHEVLNYDYRKYVKSARKEAGEDVVNMLARVCTIERQVAVVWADNVTNLAKVYNVGHLALSILIGAAEKFSKLDLTEDEKGGRLPLSNGDQDETRSVQPASSADEDGLPAGEATGKPVTRDDLE